MTAVQKERLEELRKIILKTGAEAHEWEALEAMHNEEIKNKEVKK